MCGIVGYVGAQSALDVVIAGLKRLEYRGYDSAGVACSPTAGWPRPRRPGKLVNLEKELVGPAAAERLHRASGTPDGPPTAGPPTPTPIPHLDNAGRVAVVHNGIIENFAALRAELAERGHELASETDTEVVAHLLAEDVLRLRRTWPRRCGRCAGGWRARSRWSPCTPTSRTWWWARGATRRSWWALERARPSSPRTWPRSSPTRGRRSSWARTRWSSCAGTGSRSPTSTGGPRTCGRTTSTGTPRPPRRAGYDYFMLKEIAEQPKAVADTLLGRIDAAGSLTLDEVRIPDVGAARGRQGRHRRVRYGLPRRA